MVSSSVELSKNTAIPEEWLDLLNSWAIAMKAEDLSPGTVEQYASMVKRSFFPFLAQMGWSGSLGALTAEHFRHWLNHLTDAGLAGATRLLRRQAVRSFYKFLKAEGEIAADPFVTSQHPPSQTRRACY